MAFDMFQITFKNAACLNCRAKMKALHLHPWAHWLGTSCWGGRGANGCCYPALLVQPGNFLFFRNRGGHIWAQGPCQAAQGALRAKGGNFSWGANGYPFWQRGLLWCAMPMVSNATAAA